MSPATDAARHSPVNLRIPGPTPLPPEVREALSRDMMNHRGPEFAAIVHECVDGLKWAFQTSHDVLLLTASGTGGLESAAVNLVEPGQRVLGVSIGYFGDRFLQIAQAFGADVQALAFPWGQAADTAVVAEKLAADPSIETLFLTHNETSTGVMNPLREIARAAREVRPDVVIAVDGISSVASAPVETDAWDLDVVVSGSQKGWMLPPGLVFVSVSPRAWERARSTATPRFYFGWEAYRKNLQKDTMPWTPAVGIIYGLQAALRLMRDEGLDGIFARHERLARSAREGLSALGLTPFADPAHASWTVTTATAPEGVDVKALLRRLREDHGVVLAGGQGPLEGRLLRLGHLGYVDQADVDGALSALRQELARLGVRGRVGV